MDSEYVVLLNSDIETTEGWLDPLIRHLDTHPETAAVQPKLRGFFDRKNLNMPARQEASSTGMRILLPRTHSRKCETDYGQYDTIVPVFGLPELVCVSAAAITLM